jgi:hypothetical protein
MDRRYFGLISSRRLLNHSEQVLSSAARIGLPVRGSDADGDVP